MVVLAFEESNATIARMIARRLFQTVKERLSQFPAVALLGPWQYYTGYCILVARAHATELSQLSDPERRGYLDEMCLLARAIEGAFQPRKLNYELLGNQVAHLHWHVLARFDWDSHFPAPV